VQAINGLLRQAVAGEVKWQQVARAGAIKH
jgi:hypothetical protein